MDFPRKNIRLRCAEIQDGFLGVLDQYRVSPLRNLADKAGVDYVNPHSLSDKSLLMAFFKRLYGNHATKEGTSDAALFVCWRIKRRLHPPGQVHSEVRGSRDQGRNAANLQKMRNRSRCIRYTIFSYLEAPQRSSQTHQLYVESSQGGSFCCQLNQPGRACPSSVPCQRPVRLSQRQISYRKCPGYPKAIACVGYFILSSIEPGIF